MSRKTCWYQHKQFFILLRGKMSPSLQVSPETAVLQLLCQDRLYPSDIWLATAYLFPCQDQMPSPCAKIDVLWLLV